MPPCLADASSNDIAGDIDERVLVQWRLPMQLGAGQILLLAIVQEELLLLHQVPST